MCLVHTIFVLFKEKTAYGMRISDWSSDVCSSDLQLTAFIGGQSGFTCARQAEEQGHIALFAHVGRAVHRQYVNRWQQEVLDGEEIGRASCRERVCQYM